MPYQESEWEQLRDSLPDRLPQRRVFGGGRLARPFIAASMVVGLTAGAAAASPTVREHMVSIWHGIQHNIGLVKEPTQVENRPPIAASPHAPGEQSGDGPVGTVGPGNSGGSPGDSVGNPARQHRAGEHPGTGGGNTGDNPMADRRRQQRGNPRHPVRSPATPTGLRVVATPKDLATPMAPPAVEIPGRDPVKATAKAAGTPAKAATRGGNSGEGGGTGEGGSSIGGGTGGGNSGEGGGNSGEGGGNSGEDSGEAEATQAAATRVRTRRGPRQLGRRRQLRRDPAGGGNSGVPPGRSAPADADHPRYTLAVGSRHARPRDQPDRGRALGRGDRAPPRSGSQITGATAGDADPPPGPALQGTASGSPRFSGGTRPGSGSPWHGLLTTIHPRHRP